MALVLTKVKIKWKNIISLTLTFTLQLKGHMHKKESQWQSLSIVRICAIYTRGRHSVRTFNNRAAADWCVIIMSHCCALAFHYAEYSSCYKTGHCPGRLNTLGHTTVKTR